MLCFLVILTIAQNGFLGGKILLSWKLRTGYYMPIASFTVSLPFSWKKLKVIFSRFQKRFSDKLITHRVNCLNDVFPNAEHTQTRKPEEKQKKHPQVSQLQDILLLRWTVTWRGATYRSMQIPGICTEGRKLDLWLLAAQRKMSELKPL